MSTFCCVQCRLLQPPTAACGECGQPMTAPVELVRELLYYRDMKMVGGRDWGLITALIAGSSIAFPVLAPVAVGSMVALAVQKIRAWRRAQGLAGIELPRPVAAPGATTLVGTPRRFRGTVSSLVDERPVLVEHATVKTRDGAVLLRRHEAAPFLLEVEDRGPVLVTGVARLGALGLGALRAMVRRGDPRLLRMGVPDDLGIAGELEVACVREGGPVLAITGVVEDEHVADLAFHRDGGRIPVLRGRPGTPLLVEDRRLLAAVI